MGLDSLTWNVGREPGTGMWDSICKRPEHVALEPGTGMGNWLNYFKMPRSG